MSRIGKLPIKLADKVKAAVAGEEVKFAGPKGKLSIRVPNPQIKVQVKDGQVLVTRPDDSRRARGLHGPTRSILANAPKGVSTGWDRTQDLRGVGSRWE